MRNGLDLKVFLDGVVVHHNTNFIYAMNLNSTTKITIGNASNQSIFGDRPFFGIIEELRISDTAVYNGNFTPPTQEFSGNIIIPTSFLVNGISGITKGVSTSLTLDKSIIMSLASVVSDSYYSNIADVEKAIIVYSSTVGNQKKELVFDMTKTTPECKIVFSNTCRNQFNISRITLKDFDGGFFIVASADIPNLTINL